MQELFEAFVAQLVRVGATHHLADHRRHQSATEAELAEAEALAGALPDDLRSWWLSADRGLPLIGAYTTLSIQHALDTARSSNQMVEDGTFDPHLAKIRSWKDGRFDDGRMREVYWSPGWLPVAMDGCGNQLCVDLSPGPSGRRGQILAMELQDGQGPYLSPWPSLRELIRGHVLLLTQDRITLDEEHAVDYGWLSHAEIEALLQG